MTRQSECQSRVLQRVGLFAFVLFHLSSSSCFAQHPTWVLARRGQVGILHTRYTDVAYYVPIHPEHILVLAHGFPWDDGTVSDKKLRAYAYADARRWSSFAESNHAVLLVPAFGGHNFPHYGQMAGRIIGPDTFVDELVDGPAARLIAHFGGRFSLHGHSAGGQFASRYLVAHPDRLEQVVLSAPSTYPMPDATIDWPYGMAPAVASSSMHLNDRTNPSPKTSAAFVPKPDGWLKAAAKDSVTVLVGSQDLEVRPPAAGQSGSNRIERGKAWICSMQKFAQEHSKVSKIRFVLADGLDHDEGAIAMPAQNILALYWSSHKKLDSASSSETTGVGPR